MQIICAQNLTPFLANGIRQILAKFRSRILVTKLLVKLNGELFAKCRAPVTFRLAKKIGEIDCRDL
jgi:hypothetical protein